uniref:HCO3_cotransp domain-containing protein n=1 Tax=Macrostomum lignano TaxID=282301 RepID=A0A1I8FDC0_9PLAT
ENFSCLPYIQLEFVIARPLPGLAILGAPFGLAIPLSMLFFMEQNIQLGYGELSGQQAAQGFRLSPGLLTVALRMNGVMSCFGLPGVHGALPHSPLHPTNLETTKIQSTDCHQSNLPTYRLATISAIRRVRETRITGVVSNILIGLSLLMCPVPLSFHPGPLTHVALPEAGPPQRKVHIFTCLQLLQLFVLCAPWIQQHRLRQARASPSSWFLQHACQIEIDPFAAPSNALLNQRVNQRVGELQQAAFLQLAVVQHLPGVASLQCIGNTHSAAVYGLLHIFVAIPRVCVRLNWEAIHNDAGVVIGELVLFGVLATYPYLAVQVMSPILCCCSTLESRSRSCRVENLPLPLTRCQPAALPPRMSASEHRPDRQSSFTDSYKFISSPPIDWH